MFPNKQVNIIDTRGVKIHSIVDLHNSHHANQYFINYACNAVAMFQTLGVSTYTELKYTIQWSCDHVLAWRDQQDLHF